MEGQKISRFFQVFSEILFRIFHRSGAAVLALLDLPVGANQPAGPAIRVERDR